MLQNGNILTQHGGFLKVQPVRQRKIYSCIACHGKKIKCSKDRPACLRCAKMGLECHYYINERVSRKASTQKAGALKVSKPATPAAARLGASDSAVRSSKGVRAVMSRDAAKAPPTDPAAVDEKDSPASNSSIASFVSVPESKPGTPATPAAVSPSVSASSRPPNDDFGGNVSDTLDGNTVLSRVSSPVSRPSTAPPPASAPARGSPRKHQLFDLIVSSIPVKSYSDSLVSAYREKVHFFIPLLDLQEFENQYNDFWDYYIANQLKGNNDWATGLFNNRLDFFLTYYIMLFGASVNATASTSNSSSSSEITHFNQIIGEIFSFLKFPRLNANYSLKYLQLFTLHQSLIPIPSIIDLAMLIRTAQLFKLDKDPVIYHQLADADLVQFRRLLWWQIVFLDMRSSLLNSVEPSICLDKFDTSLPVEIDADKKSIINIVVMNSKFRFCGLLNEVLNSNLGDVRRKIIDLYVRCNGSILALTNYMENHQLQAKEEKLMQFVIDDLKLIPDKAVFLLYKRCYRSNSYILPISTSQIAQRHNIYFNYNDYNVDTENFEVTFLHFLHHFIDINQKYPDQVCLSWSLESHLFVHAVLLLLSNLIVELNHLTQTTLVSGKTLTIMIVEFLQNDIKFQLLQQLHPIISANLQSKPPKLVFWQKSLTLINSLCFMVKIFGLKFNDDDQFSSVHEFLDTYGLNNRYNDPVVSFLEPYSPSSSMGNKNRRDYQTTQYDQNEAISSSATNDGRTMSDKHDMNFDPKTYSNDKNQAQTQNNDSSTADETSAINCAAIAPRSMTALAAATTMTKIGVFGSSLDANDIVQSMRQEPAPLFGSGYNNYVDDDGLPVIPSEVQEDIGPSNASGNGHNSDQPGAQPGLQHSQQNSLVVFEKEKQLLISTTMINLSIAEANRNTDLEIPNEYVDSLINELQRLLHYL